MAITTARATDVPCRILFIAPDTMSYQVLALKYRPQTFDDVVGQGHVTTTLVNAIQAERVAHAILFTGPRGTGKTTIARILAKALNCKGGPTPSPCNTCKICTDIIEGHCSDVFEIDGASNNSVDQIRDLRENVTYMPSAAPYKIYIIDEVHMLSTAAFNALLKTLEEPPAHVKFIFATTEVHKIPATILSRCQRHDLGRVPLEQISAHLNSLCTQEDFTVDSQGLDLIAQEADGSIRDSLSLLDRILSAAPDKEISYAQVVEGLGVIDRQLMFDIAQAIFQGNGAQLIQAVEQINDAGMDLKKFYDDIVLHFRNMNVIKLCGPDHTAVNLTEADKARIHDLIAPLPQGYIGLLLQNLLTDAGLVKFSAHTRTAVETVLLKLLQLRKETDLDGLIKKIDALARDINKKFSDGEISPPGLKAAVQAAPAQPVQAAQPAQVAPQASPAPAQPAPAPSPQMPPAAPPVNTPAAAPPVQPPAMPAQPAMSAPEPPPLPPEYEAETVRTQEEEPVQTPAPPRGNGNWADVLMQVESKVPFIHARLAQAPPPQMTPDGNAQITIPECSAFEKKRITGKQGELNAICQQVMGKSLVVKFSKATTTKAAAASKSKEDFQARQAAMNHPLALEAKRIFNGEILI